MSLTHVHALFTDDADDKARQDAQGQRAATAVMGMALIALATVLVLRTGVLQAFASALMQGLGIVRSSAGAGAAAASLLLAPGLRRRLSSATARRIFGEDICCAGVLLARVH